MRLSLVVSVEDTGFDAVAIRAGWEAGVARLAELGFDGVELAVRDPGVIDHDRVEAVVRGAGLAVPAIGTGQAYLRDGLSLSSVDPEVRQRAAERLAAHVELASHFGSHVIVGLLRGRTDGGVEATTYRFLEALTPVLRAADSAGVRVVIEPINRYETDFLNTVEATLAVVEASGASNLGILADTFHMNIEEATIHGALQAAGPRLWHVHVADSNRWAPGLGHLDFPAIVETLRRCGYQGYLSAEILPRPDPDAAAIQVERFMRPIAAGGGQ